ncbi:MAG: hypothetical protein RI907_3021 [Pseudomonadota bacterium]|jgi:hypothetical protein
MNPSPPTPDLDPGLSAARRRAEAALRDARNEFARQHPERALLALHRAWDALVHVPGGEAFDDLVALDDAIERAYRHLDLAHADLAAQTMDQVIARLHA